MQWLWVIIIGFLVGLVAKWFAPGPYGFIVTTLLAVPDEISPGVHLEGENLFKAALDGADLAGAFLDDEQFLNCAHLVVTRNWQSASRDAALGSGAPILSREA